MTEEVTRRTVLRRGVAASGGLAVGIAGATGTAAATLDCPRPFQYWKNHPAKFGDTRTHFRLDRSGARYDRETTYAVLRDPPGADKALQLARQVVVAQANVAAIRVGEGGACEEAATEIKPRIGDALTWLARSDDASDDRWAYVAAPDDYTLTWTWEDARGVDGEPIRDDLRAFNRGETCDHCGGSGEDEPETEDDAESGPEPGDESGPDFPFRPWRTFVDTHLRRD
ncbi:hypothetical protein [Halostella litorea]|uniref:hypothetical protein n=1 Tax=Halostella litorea TaxID=2528831 RepID=UPI0010919BD7|nr:hypothetical protein [Halostella litorea]